MVQIEARVRDGAGWDQAITVRARSVESGRRTAARKLGLCGPILTTHRVGSSQFESNVDGVSMMTIEVQSCACSTD